jgi:RND superfamily putative drug exporter
LPQSHLHASGQFTRLLRPLDPNGTALSPSELSIPHHRLGPPGSLPVVPAPGTDVTLSAYEAYRSTSQLVSANGRTTQFEATLAAGPPTTTRAMLAVPKIRSAVTEAAHAAGARASGVAGEAAGIYDVNQISTSDLLRIVPVAIVLIGLLMVLVLRSLVAPLYLIASAAISYLAALGPTVLVFVEIAGWSGLGFILPFLMFIFLLALGEDYNILVMTRINLGHDPDQGRSPSPSAPPSDLQGHRRHRAHRDLRRPGPGRNLRGARNRLRRWRRR